MKTTLVASFLIAFVLAVAGTASAVEVARAVYRAGNNTFEVSGVDASTDRVDVYRYDCPLVNVGDGETIPPRSDCDGNNGMSTFLARVDAKKNGGFRFRTNLFSSRNPVPCLVYVTDGSGVSRVVKVDNAPYFCALVVPPEVNPPDDVVGGP